MMMRVTTRIRLAGALMNNIDNLGFSWQGDQGQLHSAEEIISGETVLVKHLKLLNMVRIDERSICFLCSQ